MTNSAVQIRNPDCVTDCVGRVRGHQGRNGQRAAIAWSFCLLFFFFTVFKFPPLEKEVKMKNSLGTGGSLIMIQISEWKRNRYKTDSVVYFNWVYCCSSFHRQGSTAALAGERDARFRRSLWAQSASYQPISLARLSPAEHAARLRERLLLLTQLALFCVTERILAISLAFQQLLVLAPVQRDNYRYDN